MPPEKVGKFVELNADLMREFQAMCDANGTTFRFELEDAMRRHLAHPPKREPEPLPNGRPKSAPRPDARKPRGGK